jgi:hypothetical protein
MEKLVKDRKGRQGGGQREEGGRRRRKEGGYMSIKF